MQEHLIGRFRLPSPWLAVLPRPMHATRRRVTTQANVKDDAALHSTTQENLTTLVVGRMMDSWIERWSPPAPENPNQALQAELGGWHTAPQVKFLAI